MVEEIRGEANVMGAANPPPKGGKDFLHATITMKGVVKTLEVDAQGLETAVELTINQAEMVQTVENDKFPDVPPVAAGTVVIGKRDNKGMMIWSSLDGGSLPPLGIIDLGDLLADDYLGWPEWDADNVAGTPELQSVGGTWALRKSSEIGNRIGAHPLLASLNLPNLVATKTSGTAKLVKAYSEAGKNWQDLEFGLNSSLEQTGKGTVSTQIKWNVRVPGNGSTGAVKKTGTVRYDIVANMDAPPKSQPSTKLKLTFNVKISEEIRYGLPPSGVHQSPGVRQTQGRSRRLQGVVGGWQIGLEGWRQIHVRGWLATQGGRGLPVFRAVRL